MRDETDGRNSDNFIRIPIRGQEVYWLTFLWFSVDKKNQLDVTFYILYFSSNSLLNMFRVTMCPSSGADDCVMLLPRVGMCRGCREVVKTGWQVVRPSRSRQLLMMGTWLPETC